MTTANDTQVGGAHYQLPIQPWDFIVSNGLGFLEGNAIKYLTRWRQKGGVDDLRKAKHYVEKLIEVAEQEPLDPAIRCWHFWRTKWDCGPLGRICLPCWKRRPRTPWVIAGDTFRRFAPKPREEFPHV